MVDQQRHLGVVVDEVRQAAERILGLVLVKTAGGRLHHGLRSHMPPSPCGRYEQTSTAGIRASRSWLVAATLSHKESALGPHRRGSPPAGGAKGEGADARLRRQASVAQRLDRARWGG